jgi:hypothetical protein
VSDRKYGGLSFSTEDTGQVLAMAGTYVLHPSALGFIGEFCYSFDGFLFETFFFINLEGGFFFAVFMYV